VIASPPEGIEVRLGVGLGRLGNISAFHVADDEKAPLARMTAEREIGDESERSEAFEKRDLRLDGDRVIAHRLDDFPAPVEDRLRGSLDIGADSVLQLGGKVSRAGDPARPPRGCSWI